MDLKSLGEILAVSAVSSFYIAWRLWDLRLATPRPGTKLATMTVEQRRERLRNVASLFCLYGAAMLCGGIWLWLRSGPR
jgi:hypothetical protein